jgi:hypothetical protein
MKVAPLFGVVTSTVGGLLVPGGGVPVVGITSIEAPARRVAPLLSVAIAEK